MRKASPKLIALAPSGKPEISIIEINGIIAPSLDLVTARLGFATTVLGLVMMGNLRRSKVMSALFAKAWKMRSQ